MPADTQRTPLARHTGAGLDAPLEPPNFFIQKSKIKCPKPPALVPHVRGLLRSRDHPEALLR